MSLLKKSTAPLPLVVMIEPSVEKAFATRLAGITEELWTTKVITKVGDLSALIKELAEKKQIPVCIGFHSTLGQLPNGKSWSPEPFHGLLQDVGWAPITILVSEGHTGSLTDLTHLAREKKYEGAVARDGWVAYLRERIYKSSDTTDSRSVPPVSSEMREPPSLGGFANRLGPAVVVLQEPHPGQAPQIVSQNESAKNRPWDRKDLRRWAWLRADLEKLRSRYPEKIPRAHLLDWDGEKKLPVECRLYDLGGGAFWYTRDWRADRERAIDEVFAKMDDKRHLADRFDALADYLAERWSISRLRLFEVALLPEERGSVGDQGQWVSSMKNAAKDAQFLVVPRVQSGLGWPNKGQEANNKTKQPTDWWRKRFTWAEFEVGGEPPTEDLMGSGSSWLKRAEVNPLVLNVDLEQYVFESMKKPCPVSDAVDWGECKRRLLVLVSDRPATNGGTQHGGTNGERPLAAMLAMDRRADHLLGKNRKDFSPSEEARRLLLSDGVIGEEMDADVVDSMNHGALSAVRDRVGHWLADARRERARQWENGISRAIAETAGQGQGMAALSQLCDALLREWPLLWQTERERLVLQGGEGETAAAPLMPNLTQLFFVTPSSARRITMPAGSGTAWKHYSQQASWPLVSPFAELLGSASDDAQGDCWVIQDFQDWLRRLEKKNGAFAKAEKACFANTGSWVAVRLSPAQGVASVLLVAHFGCEPRQVWLEVLQLLQKAAHHLRAPFLLAWREAQERAVWASSVAHEMKNMALLALHDAQQNPSYSPLLIERLQQQVNLADDFLFNLRPDLSPDMGLIDKVERVDVAKVVQSALAWWHEERPQAGEGIVEWAAGVDFASVWLKGAQVWQRVLRVLLHNAFRHGEGGVKVSGAVLPNSLATGQPSLCLTVENFASETSSTLLKQTASPSLTQVPSAYVRRHIGLQTARALCEKAGAELKIEVHKGHVVVSLDWPVGAAGDAQQAGPLAEKSGDQHGQ